MLTANLRTMRKQFLLRRIFLHRDSYFIHVADKQVLTLPWFVEAEQKPWPRRRLRGRTQDTRSTAPSGHHCDRVSGTRVMAVGWRASLPHDAARTRLGEKSMLLLTRNRNGSGGLSAGFVAVLHVD
jgi:hypothetical protein